MNFHLLLPKPCTDNLETFSILLGLVCVNFQLFLILRLLRSLNVFTPYKFYSLILFYLTFILVVIEDMFSSAVRVNFLLIPVDLMECVLE